MTISGPAPSWTKGGDPSVAAEPETLRFRQLLPWFYSIGCCLICAMDLSIATIEKEYGRPYTTSDCVHGEKPGCKARARAAWKQLPAKEAA